MNPTPSAYWDRMRHPITHWLPKLRYRTIIIAFITYSLTCITLNYFINTTFENNNTRTEHRQIEQIAEFYRTNPLVDRYGLIIEGHSLWETIGHVLPTLYAISLYDAQGIPLACFQRSPLSGTTLFKVNPSCTFLPPSPLNNQDHLWTSFANHDVFWQAINTSSIPGGWLRIETRPLARDTSPPFFRALVSAEIALGILLLTLLYIMARHFEKHIDTLTQRLRLFDYSGFKNTSRTDTTLLPWTLSDFEWTLHNLLNRVQKEILRLQQAEQNLYSIFNNLKGAVIQLDHHGHCLFLSSCWSTLTGTPIPSLLSETPFIELIQAEQTDHYLENIQTLLSGECNTATCRITLRSTTSPCHLELHMTRYAPTPETPTILIYAFDCNTHLEHEQKLQQETTQYRQWLESLPLPMYVKNHLGQYLFFNLAWETLTQIPRNQWIGKTAWDVFEPDFAQTLWDREQKTFAQKTTTVHETHVRNQAGQTFPSQVYRAPILDHDQIIGMIGIIANLDTPVHHTNLQTKLEHIEQQDRLHTQMLVHLCHEVQTHLHSLLGLIDLMGTWLKTLALPHNNEYFGLIQSLAHNILNTTTDVNDILSFEQQTLLPQSAAFSPETVLIECARHFSPQAESKHLELIVNIDPELPDQLEGDAYLLRRGLDPLIHNAIKFTPSGTVELSATLLHIEYAQACIRFSISDTGIGIHEDQHQHVFEPFTQGDAALSRQYHKGSGLGLTVFSRLMQHLGAEYTIHSKAGQGTTISFDWSLPYIQTPPSTTTTALQHWTILIVEDHARTAHVIAQLATHWSMNIVTARTIHQAISILTPSDTTPITLDAVLIDGRFSDEDRSAPYRVLEAAHAAGIPHRLMMLPVNAPFREHERYRQAHATAILLKPIQRQELLDALLTPPVSMATLLQDTSPLTHIPSTNHESPPPPKARILLATHDPINRKLVEGWLEQLGHRCITIGSGEELMSYYTSDRFGAVFIDLDMPRSGGIELLRLVNLQNQILNYNTPIIAMFSGKHGEPMIAGDIPIWSYIQKPIQQTVLSTILHSLPSPNLAHNQNTEPDKR